MGVVMGPWVTFDELKAKLTDRLSVGTLIPRWNSIIADALNAGYRDLRAVLVSRGYSEAQLDAWDDRASYNTDQSLFWCFVNGAGLGAYSDQDYNKLDHRKELKDDEFGISIGGAIVLPGTGADDSGGVFAGLLTINTGDVSEHSTYRTQADRRYIRQYGGLNEGGPEQW